MTLKSKWRAILIGCCTSNSLSVPLESKRSIPNRQSSTQRLPFSDISDPGSPLSVNELPSSLKGSNLHTFTFAEVKVIANDFSSSQFLGEGGFGPVFKGFIDSKIRPGLEAQAVAVKLLDMEGTQGHREWLTEVVFLGQLRHPHLVKLVGYCCEDENRVLVYEYMAKGDLENQLFRRFSISLPWSTRIKIAVGAARGLAFLHGEEKPVIFRDFKTSNILLGTDYTAKLSDFGLAKDGPEEDHSHVTTRVMGTHGYAAPEYVMTGHLTTMSDVYSFGVVLLELLTGRRATDRSRPTREQNLVEWARPLLKDFRKLDRLMDPNLDGQYCMEGARKAATLAYHCLSHRAKSRPTMNNVVKTLENIFELKDSQVGTFVYIVPTDGKKIDAASRANEHEKNEEEKENSTNSNSFEEDEAKELKGNRSRRGRNGLRHRHRHKLRSRAVYSDTSLYRTLKKPIKIAEVQRLKGCNP